MHCVTFIQSSSLVRTLNLYKNTNNSSNILYYNNTRIQYIQKSTCHNSIRTHLAAQQPSQKAA